MKISILSRRDYIINYELRMVDISIDNLKLTIDN